MITLFISKESPSLVMNRYGVVLDGARICQRQERDQVIREAMAAGWHLSEAPENADVGRVWLPPGN
jgi:hypothetical protein